MSSYAPIENVHAKKAASAARILGIVMIVLGGLALLAILLAGRALRGPAQMSIMLLMLGVYFAPGITLIILSSRVRSGGRGATIAVMIIGILVAGLMFLSIIGNAISRVASTNVMSIVFALVMGLIAALLAVYCSQSLGHLKHHGESARGFEPIFAPPPLPRDEAQG